MLCGLYFTSQHGIQNCETKFSKQLNATMSIFIRPYCINIYLLVQQKFDKKPNKQDQVHLYIFLPPPPSSVAFEYKEAAVLVF